VQAEIAARSSCGLQTRTLAALAECKNLGLDDNLDLAFWCADETSCGLNDSAKG